MLMNLNNCAYLNKISDDDTEGSDESHIKSHLTAAFKEVKGYKLTPITPKIQDNSTLYIIAHHC